MNISRTTVILTLLTSLLFFLAGRFFYESIFSFLEPHIKGIEFIIVSNERTIKTSLLFSITVALIPLITMLAWTCLSLSFSKRLVSVVIIVACISFAVFARHMAVKNYFNTVVVRFYEQKHITQVSYPIDPRNFVFKIMMGFAAGLALSCLLVFFKRRPRS